MFSPPPVTENIFRLLVIGRYAVTSCGIKFKMAIALFNILPWRGEV